MAVSMIALREIWVVNGKSCGFSGKEAEGASIAGFSVGWFKLIQLGFALGRVFSGRRFAI